MNSDQLKERTKQLSLSVIRLVSTIPHNRETDALVRQVVRSASSVAANYRSACKARSKADFVNKINIVEEEVDETEFWLDHLCALDFLKKDEAYPLIKEARELTAIFTAAGKTAKSNLRNQIRNYQSPIRNK